MERLPVEEAPAALIQMAEDDQVEYILELISKYTEDELKNIIKDIKQQNGKKESGGTDYVKRILSLLFTPERVDQIKEQMIANGIDEIVRMSRDNTATVQNAYNLLQRYTRVELKHKMFQTIKNRVLEKTLSMGVTGNQRLIGMKPDLIRATLELIFPRNQVDIVMPRKAPVAVIRPPTVVAPVERRLPGLPTEVSAYVSPPSTRGTSSSPIDIDLEEDEDVMEEEDVDMMGYGGVKQEVIEEDMPSRPSTLELSRGMNVEEDIDLEDEDMVGDGNGDAQPKKRKSAGRSERNKKSRKLNRDKPKTETLKDRELERQVEDIFTHQNITFVQFEINNLFGRPPPPTN